MALASPPLPPWPEADDGADPARRSPARRGRAARLSASAARAARRVPWWDAAGIAGLALMGACFSQFDEYEPWLYRGGFVVLAIVTATVIVASVRPGGWLGARVLDRQPLRWIGERIYGIDLWHWPIFTMTRPQLNVALDPIPDLALRVALTLLAAEASYRFVGSPRGPGACLARVAFRAQGAPRLGVPLAGRDERRGAGPRGRGGGARGRRHRSTAALVPGGHVDRHGRACGCIRRAGGGTGREPVHRRPGDPGAAGRRRHHACRGWLNPRSPRRPGRRPSPRPPATARPLWVLAIGDSVMLGAVTQLRQAVHGIEVNAAIGRSFGVGVQILQQRRYLRMGICESQGRPLIELV